MKAVSKNTLFAAFAMLAGAAFAQAPDLIRGPLSADLKAQIRAPLKVATCPPAFRELFANQKLSCERAIRQAADVACPSGFPNYTARNVSSGSDRDLCAKAGVNLPSTGALTGVQEGRDFLRLPADGAANGRSFVAGHPDAAEVNGEGWSLNTNNTDASGIRDRYQRTITLKTSPILVNP